MREFLCLLVGAAILLRWPADAACQDDSVADTIEKQWALYKKKFAGYQPKSTSIYVDTTTGAKVVFSGELRQRGVSRVFLFGVKQEKRTYGNGYGFNEDYAFELGKEGDKPWSLCRIDTETLSGAAIPWFREMSPEFALAFSPYTLFGNGELPSLLKRIGFSLTKTESVRSPHGDAKKFWFTISPDEFSAPRKGRQPEGKGWVILDPSCYWRILEIELPFDARKEPRKELARFVYEMADGDFPLVKRIETTLLDGQGRAKTRGTITYEIEKRDASEDEFKLSAFGLPEPTLTRRSWWTRPHIWLSGAGLLCVGLVLTIRRYKQGNGDRR